MNPRTIVATLVVLASVVFYSVSHDVVRGQACGNTSPDRPTTVTATRTADGEVLVEWSINGLCEASKFYLEASRGTAEIIEETVDDGDERSVLLALGAGTETPWRISVRAFNEFGLSPGRSAVLAEGVAPPVPNPCPAGTLFPPTLVSANAVGRILTVQWQPDSRCIVSGYVIVGQAHPDGPVLGSIEIPYPTTSWSGPVPSGSYYVRVVPRYYAISGQMSNAIFVHVP